jgi:hypothetical protein
MWMKERHVLEQVVVPWSEEEEESERRLSVSCVSLPARMETSKDTPLLIFMTYP